MASPRQKMGRARDNAVRPCTPAHSRHHNCLEENPCHQREDPMSTGKKMDFTAATARARHIRELYKQLEERLHASAWTPQELMLGYLYDIGELGRLVMAAEDRWLHKGDLPRELEDKLSECLWWVLVLADRLGVDITKAFTTKMNELDVQLTKSVARSKKRPKSATANSRRALRLRVAG